MQTIQGPLFKLTDSEKQRIAQGIFLLLDKLSVDNVIEDELEWMKLKKLGEIMNEAEYHKWLKKRGLKNGNV